jgi:hypothetical protein
MVLQEYIESFARTIPNIAIHPADVASWTKHPSPSSTVSYLKSLLPFKHHATETKMLTSKTEDSSMFPNVLVPHYEHYAGKARSLSDNVIDSISFVPLIHNTLSNNETIQDVANWNKFSQERHQEMIYDIIKDLDSSINTTTIKELSIRNNILGHPVIWSHDEYNNNNQNKTVDTSFSGQLNESNSTGTNKKYYGPLWQISPLIETTSSNVINFDLFSLNHISLLLDTILSQNQQPSTNSTIRTADGLLSAVTTNLGPLYCMSTSIECMTFTEQQQYELLQVQEMINNNEIISSDTNQDSTNHIQFEQVFGASERNLPRSLYLQPIYENVNEVISNNLPNTNVLINTTNTKEYAENRLPVGVIASVIVWENLLGMFIKKKLSSVIETPFFLWRANELIFVNVFFSFTDSITTLVLQSSVFAVLKNTCGQSFTYNISAGQVAFIGPEDLHNHVSFHDTEYIIPLGTQRTDAGQCSYSLYLYSAQQQLDLMTENPLNPHGIDWVTAWIVIMFIILLYIFCVFDTYVKLRNARVLNVASRGERILATLFPKQVRDRMFEEEDKAAATGTAMKNDLKLPEQLYHAPDMCVKTVLSTDRLFNKRGHPTSVDGGEMSGDELQEFLYKSKPIADLFPETTILFAGMYIKMFVHWVKDCCFVVY